MAPDPIFATFDRLVEALRRELDVYTDEMRRIVDGAMATLLAKLDEILDRLVLLEQKVERASVTGPPVRPRGAACRCRPRRRGHRSGGDDTTQASGFEGPSR